MVWKFHKFTKSIHHKQSDSDHTLFLKHKEEKSQLLIVCVDDMVGTGNDLEEKENTTGASCS